MSNSDGEKKKGWTEKQKLQCPPPSPLPPALPAVWHQGGQRPAGQWCKWAREVMAPWFLC